MDKRVLPRHPPTLGRQHSVAHTHLPTPTPTPPPANTHPQISRVLRLSDHKSLRVDRRMGYSGRVTPPAGVISEPFIFCCQESHSVVKRRILMLSGLRPAEPVNNPTEAKKPAGFFLDFRSGYGILVIEATGGHRGPQGATGGHRGHRGPQGATGATGGHRGHRWPQPWRHTICADEISHFGTKFALLCVKRLYGK